MKIGIERVIELLDAGLTFREAGSVVMQELKQRRIPEKAELLDHVDKSQKEADMREYCTQNDQDCESCSLVNYGRDCNNQAIEIDPSDRAQVDNWAGKFFSDIHGPAAT